MPWVLMLLLAGGCKDDVGPSITPDGKPYFSMRCLSWVRFSTILRAFRSRYRENERGMGKAPAGKTGAYI